MLDFVSLCITRSVRLTRSILTLIYMALTQDRHVPSTMGEWSKMVAKAQKAHGLDKNGQVKESVSGSNFEVHHFLSLRAIWRIKNVKLLFNKLRGVAIDRKFITEAHRILSEQAGWKSYLTAISNFRKDEEPDRTVASELHRWIIPWQLHRNMLFGKSFSTETGKLSSVTASPGNAAPRRQPFVTPTKSGQGAMLAGTMDTPLEEILRRTHVNDWPSPADEREGQPIKDEQTVNSFLLAFLTALSATDVAFRTQWQADRVLFVFRENNITFKARVDGILSSGGFKRGVIEVKPRVRTDVREFNVRHQETAQTAAWISQEKINSHDPTKKCESV